MKITNEKHKCDICEKEDNIYININPTVYHYSQDKRIEESFLTFSTDSFKSTYELIWRMGNCTEHYLCLDYFERVKEAMTTLIGGNDDEDQK